MLKILMFFIIVNTFIYSSTVNLRIAYEDKAQPPYYIGEGSAIPVKNPGISIEILKEVEKRIKNLKIEFVRYPWPRCLQNLKDNKVDGIFNSSYTSERAEAIGWYPTINGLRNGPVDSNKKIASISYYLYVNRDSKITWDGNRINGLKGSVGAMIGYSIVDDLKKMGYKVEEAISTELNLKKLIANRIEILALQEVTADSFIESNNSYSSIKKLEPALESKDYYLMLSDKFVKDNPKLSREIWDAIELVRKEKLDLLLKSYN